MNTVLSFLFSHVYEIIWSLWILLFIAVAVRYWKPNLLGNISYLKLFFIVLGFHILYASFLTWAQYYVWSMTKYSGVFNKLSYFAGYVFIHFWLNIVLLILVSGALYLIFRIWRNYRGGFSAEGPMLLFVLMLISGWPGILVTIALGFIVALLLMIFHFVKSTIKKIPLAPILIEPAFIFSTIVSLLFTNFILRIVL